MEDMIITLYDIQTHVKSKCIYTKTSNNMNFVYLWWYHIAGVPSIRWYSDHFVYIFEANITQHITNNYKYNQK